MATDDMIGVAGLIILGVIVVVFVYAMYRSNKVYKLCIKQIDAVGDYRMYCLDNSIQMRKDINFDYVPKFYYVNGQLLKPVEPFFGVLDKKIADEAKLFGLEKFPVYRINKKGES